MAQNPRSRNFGSGKASSWLFLFFFPFISDVKLIVNVFLIFGRAMKRPVGILYVKVLRAMNLKKKDVFGASDPYVKLKLTEDKLPSKKTSVKHKNLNPEWNEEFHIVVKDPGTQALELIVYDWEKVWSLNVMGLISHISSSYSCIRALTIIPIKAFINYIPLI